MSWNEIRTNERLPEVIRGSCGTSDISNCLSPFLKIKEGQDRASSMVSFRESPFRVNEGSVDACYVLNLEQTVLFMLGLDWAPEVGSPYVQHDLHKPIRVLSLCCVLGCSNEYRRDLSCSES